MLPSLASIAAEILLVIKRTKCAHFFVLMASHSLIRVFFKDVFVVMLCSLIFYFNVPQICSIGLGSGDYADQTAVQYTAFKPVYRK